MEQTRIVSGDLIHLSQEEIIENREVNEGGQSLEEDFQVQQEEAIDMEIEKDAGDNLEKEGETDRNNAS